LYGPGSYERETEIAFTAALVALQAVVCGTGIESTIVRELMIVPPSELISPKPFE
jgi:hypothetical protein